MSQSIASNNRIVAMLFSDIKDFSTIRNDDLVEKVDQFLSQFRRQFLTPQNHIFVRTWGDGQFIVGDDPGDLAEIALNLRDKFRNADWTRLGFSAPLMVRTGLHVERVRIHAENGEVIDVVGTNVSTAARIEPIVEPNQVFCSDIFYKHLANNPQSNMSAVPLGQKQLAKNFGPMELYRLLWAHETTSTHSDTPAAAAPAILIPRIKRAFSDKDINDFLDESFHAIVEYFRNALQALGQQEAGVETEFKPDGANKLRCKIYMQGQVRAQCFIRISGDFSSNGIRYSEGGVWNEDSMNDLLSVQHDDRAMYVKALMGSISVPQARIDRMTPEQAAQYLWLRFIRPLTS